MNVSMAMAMRIAGHQYENEYGYDCDYGYVVEYGYECE